LLGFVGMCMFAGTLPATRLAVAGFDPFFLTVARATIAGFTGLIVIILTRRRLPPRSLWLEIFIAASFTVVCFPLSAALAANRLRSQVAVANGNNALKTIEKDLSGWGHNRRRS
jgi:drug/metabolite transporter (DMT)-like permease